VFTSDHGESLGEHGEATHGIFAYEATLRVPLILYQPRLFEPRVAREPARHVDLLPTILDALSLPVPEGLPGRSLLGEAAAASAEPTTSYFEALSGQLNRGWAPLYGVIRQRTKYIDLPLHEVYDLGSDAAEARNLAAREPARLEELRSLLAPLLHPASDRRSETAETRQRLKSLGYLAAGATPTARSYTAEDDPKRLIELDSVLQEVIGHYLAAELPAALARCRELVRRRPGMAMSLLTLAQLERESGNSAAAVDALRKVVTINPADTRAVSLLGATLTQLERAREAVELLEPYVRVEQPDVDLLLVRGLALAKLARFDEAHAEVAKAGRVDPSNARVLVSQGTIHLMSDDRGRARASFEAALALNPDVARAHSSLGVIAAEEGRVQDAIAHWKRAVSDDPREWGQLLTLGTLFWRRGQPAEARPYFEFFVAAAPSSPYARDIERVRTWLATAPQAPSSRPPD
jgi:tetratricopeptide (TPR) repeat protein